MSGTLRINTDARWMPASWVYDDVLGALADGVEREDAALAEELRSGRTSVSVGYADLSDATDAGFRALLETATQLRDYLARTATEDRQGMLSALAELRALLRTDPRHPEVDVLAEIAVSDSARLDVPGWAADFVRDNLAAAGIDVSGRNGTLDLRELDVSAYARVVPAIDELLQRYRGELPSISVAALLTETLTPLLTALVELLHADPRAPD